VLGLYFALHCWWDAAGMQPIRTPRAWPRRCRMSLSWPRLIPKGSRTSTPSADGLRFYKDLLKELQGAGIAPAVTLFHWDLPQALQARWHRLSSAHQLPGLAASTPQLLHSCCTGAL
jgi:hypothetical protein